MARRIVLLGGPGAGKGTQAARLVERDGVVHISTGDIFRGHIQSGTEVGKEIQGYINKGKLAPDDLTCQIVSERLTEPDCAAGYVLDGFPRTLPQAEALDVILAKRGEALDLAIELHVEDDEIVRRLTARRSCPDCGHIYNLVFSPPAVDNRCDDCDTELSQREDDKEDTIRRRLRVYHDETEPIIAYYEREGLLRSVESGGKSPDEIAKSVGEIVSTTGVS